MWGWIRKKGLEVVTSSQLKELENWISILKQTSSQDIGIVLIVAHHVRMIWRDSYSQNFLFPPGCLNEDKFIALKIGNHIKDAQSIGNNSLASGYFPWLYTMRAATHPELMHRTVDLWRELERGFPYTESQAIEFSRFIGAPLPPEEYHKIPFGFEF